ncbi:MAG: ExbD/TolR family protein [Gemmatimonadales bacterium]
MTSEINVTPMIDVMLVLLIIFMIVTPLIAAGFKATLPRGDNLTSDAEKAQCNITSGAPLDPECEVILGIDETGAYFLQGRSISEADLQNTLAAIFANRTDNKVLYLKADNQLRYARVQQAVEMARAAGVRVLAAVTEPESRGGIFQTEKKN